MNVRVGWTLFAGLWRRVRAIVVLTVVCIGAGYGILWLVDGQRLRPGAGEPSEDLIVALALIGLPLIVSAAAVLLANSDTDRLSVALPQRVFRMPLRSWKIAFVHLLFGISVGAAVALAGAIPALFMLNVKFAWWLPAIAAAVLMPLIQVWAIAMGEVGIRTAVPSFVGYFGVLAYFVQQPFVVGLLNSGSTAKLVGIAALLVMTIFGATCAVVRVQRSGGWRARISARGGAASASSKPRRRFRSLSGTQFWYEWRQFGLLLPAYVGGIAAAYFLGLPLVVGLFNISDVTGRSSNEPLFRVDWFSSAQFVWMGLFLSAFLGSLAVGGVMFMRGGHWNSSSNYLLTRPLSLARISNARLKVVAASAAVALAILALMTIGMEAAVRSQGASTGLGRYLHQGYEQMPLAVTVAMYFGFLLMLMWGGAWPLSYVAVMGAFAAFLLPAYASMWGGALIGAVEISDAQAKLKHISPLLNWGAALVVLGGLFTAAWRTNSKRLLHPALPWLCALLWLGSSWAFVRFMTRWEIPAGVQSWYVRFPHPINWPMWLGVSIVPLLPIFLHPIMLQRIRHR